jgi:hypothetical protein
MHLCPGLHLTPPTVRRCGSVLPDNIMKGTALQHPSLVTAATFNRHGDYPLLTAFYAAMARIPCGERSFRHCTCLKRTLPILPGIFFFCWCTKTISEPAGLNSEKWCSNVSRSSIQFRTITRLGLSLGCTLCCPDIHFRACVMTSSAVRELVVEGDNLDATTFHHSSIFDAYAVRDYLERAKEKHI